MLPAVLLSASLVTALFVQLNTSWLAGAWLPLFLAGCIAAYDPKENGGPLWWAALAWLLALVACVFFIRPVMGGANTLWVLAALPLAVLSISQEHLKGILLATLGVVTVYAVGLILQMLLHAVPSDREILVHPGFRPGYAYAWPLVDPNNAACILNFALIPCFWLGLKDRRWLALVAIFAFAHIATASKAGGIAAFIGCLILLADHLGRKFRVGTLTVLGCLTTVSIIPVTALDKTLHGTGLAERPAMWKTCLQMISIHPGIGFGAGTFPVYYAQFRTEHTTGGYFAHNDLLQFAVEFGLPATAVFGLLMLTVLLTTRRTNLVATATLLAIGLEAMIEFQFYLPAVSILTGIALAYHRLNQQRTIP